MSIRDIDNLTELIIKKEETIKSLPFKFKSK